MEDEDWPPAREVVSRSPAKTVRVLNLRGVLDAPIECESKFERDFVYRAALCPGLLRLRHQPFRLTLSTGRRYTPDFLAVHRDGRVAVFEVKPKKKVAQYQAIFSEVAQRLEARGFTFSVVTEEHIRYNKTHERAALILRYRKTLPDPRDVDRIQDVLAWHGGAMPIAALIKHASVPQEVLFHLFTRRVVVTSRDLPVAGNARVRLFNDLENHHAIRSEGWLGVSPWKATPRGDTRPGRQRGSISGRPDASSSNDQDF